MTSKLSALKIVKSADMPELKKLKMYSWKIKCSTENWRCTLEN